MDILHLTYFIEVARQKSFTKASQFLHVSQPSISKVIKTLENELGVTLFERLGREIELTDVGKAVFKRAQSVVSEFHDLSSEIHDVVNIKHGEITIGLPPMVGSRFFPSVIGAFKKAYPQVMLKLIEVGSKQVELDVKNGLLDIGVIALPLTESEIESFTFVKEELRAVLPIDHPLANRATLSLAELKDEDFILYSNDFSLNGLIYKECQKNNFSPNIVCQSSQWDFIAETVNARLGIALLPETICKELDDKKCINIPLNNASIPWNLAIIWKKNKYQSFATREWLKLCKQHFKNRYPNKA
ncbi:LysR family transcriptional regulator [Anaerosinus massiliensis]|uniref:LysR family transcriptional regulator n=1 Tax=Massilibacillus massiliensis TaxID=1806837 RepID=UPI000B0A0131|nr:LysR family transcriptional regulator [Massilibacillus massiliensis]